MAQKKKKVPRLRSPRGWGKRDDTYRVSAGDAWVPDEQFREYLAPRATGFDGWHVAFDLCGELVFGDL